MSLIDTADVMALWKKALPLLIARSTLSKREIERRGGALREQLARWMKGPYGPSVDKLERMLESMQLSWHDWAIACEEVARGNSGENDVSPEVDSKPRKPHKVVGLKRGRG